MWGIEKKLSSQVNDENYGEKLMLYSLEKIRKKMLRSFLTGFQYSIRHNQKG